VSVDLVADGITVRFGGLLAVNNVTLRARSTTITGLIGPNGAGKTTCFNAFTGAVSTETGAVRLGERDLTGSPSSRAQQGLGRTFQRMEIFDSMTVAENVAMGPEAVLAGRRLWSQLAGGRREMAEINQRADEAMERCGIGDLGGRDAGDLSTGERRLVELARAVASRFEFLLLDEPSSGLDVDETARFGSILHSVVADGTGILLVEHDMALVRMVCEYIYLLDFGQLVFEGTTAEVLASDIVRAAYLGSEAVEDAIVEGATHA
jgi:ABC-type branched-subunit amino acid transport system ATPase component